MSMQTGAVSDVQIASDEAEVRRCHSAFRELRPHLTTEDEFVVRWRRQTPEGYKLAYIAMGDRVPAAAGYRVMHTMAWGHIIYIDDLIAAEASRGTGLGRTLLLYIQDEARKLGCEAVHLDTGYQRHRAHGVYLRAGFELNCHHLAWQVDHG
jgi:GNAT superfamily N-acetyltransferase